MSHNTHRMTKWTAKDRRAAEAQGRAEAVEKACAAGSRNKVGLFRVRHTLSGPRSIRKEGGSEEAETKETHGRVGRGDTNEQGQVDSARTWLVSVLLLPTRFSPRPRLTVTGQMAV
jgi:hypothetical protein